MLQVMKRTIVFLAFSVSLIFSLLAQTRVSETYVLKPDRIFDGVKMHTNWWLVVTGKRIIASGEPASIQAPADAKVIDMKGMTLMPGMIEGHSHMFLHPYNEAPWNDQVLIESRAERTARAVNHARETLMAGFTSARDLGTEGAMYDDVGLKEAINKGIIPGPRLMVATRAIVATGSYGQKDIIVKLKMASLKAARKLMG